MNELISQNENVSKFELAQRQAKAWCSSTLVPKTYMNNFSNCLVALEIAQRIDASPLMVMQNLYVVHGNPAWSAKFLIASFNKCGRFSSIRYSWEGEKGTDSRGCRAWAIEKSTNDKIQGPIITIALAKKEGWYAKNGSKWQTIPDLMLMYRSAAWLVNTHAPEISMGLNTVDEMEDVYTRHEAINTCNNMVADKITALINNKEISVSDVDVDVENLQNIQTGCDEFFNETEKTTI